MKIIHCADIHLDSPLRGLTVRADGLGEAMGDVTRRAFDALIALCEAEKPDVLLIAGDLYDGDWKDFNTGLWLVGRLARLRSAGVRVFIVQGNHDAESVLTKRLPVPAHVTLFAARKAESVVLEDLGLAVHGRSFPTRDTTENLAASYPPPLPGLVNIGLLHTALAGTDGHAPYAPCSLDQLKAHGYDYWALGHVHQRQILSAVPLIAYPGNLQGRHARETGAKGALVVTLEPGTPPKVRFVALDVLRWAAVAVDLSDCASEPEALDAVRAALDSARAEADGRPLAVRLRVHGATAAHARIAAADGGWRQAVEALTLDMDAVWLEKLLLDTVPPLDRTALLHRDDPLGEVLRAAATYAQAPDMQAAFAAAAGPLLARLAEAGLSPPDAEGLAAEAERLLLAALAAEVEAGA